ncbi:MAG: hypothetical protein EXR54_01770 [Dehalococcoidia bacterium]|nr:hypothetical protein [Dehalococcoidia bacterium]MSQ16288.1 hypothetical protein [Dehalococcoidia bacterium]
MPAKGRRVAVRQAELRSRKRRTGPAAGDGADTPAAGVATAERATNDSSSQAGDSPVAAPAPAAVARAPRVARGRGEVRARGQQVSAYAYAGSEMRRIFIVTGVVFAILVTLTFLLK